MTLHSIRHDRITPAGYYGPYRTIDILVPGVQDTVYLAERADTGARVALRVFAEDAARDEDLLRALRDHAGRVTTLSARCPAIATVYECGVTPDALYLALEHPDGVTLAEALRRDGPFRPERAVRVAIGIAEPARGRPHAGRRPRLSQPAERGRWWERTRGSSSPTSASTGCGRRAG